MTTARAAALALVLVAALGAGRPQDNQPQDNQPQDNQPQDNQPQDNGPQESWATPGLKGTRLHPEAPFVAETDVRPGFTRQIVRVQWRPLDPITLFVIRPKGVAKPPAVLYLYSYPEDTHRFLDDGYCERVTRGGCAAVGFESALTGGRYHDRPMREWFVSELPEALAGSAHDVQLILDYLAARGDVDMSRVGMFGQGSGGTIAILAAAADARIRVLDLLNPWGDWPDWLAGSGLVPAAERPRYITAAFQKAVATLDPRALLPRLRGRRIRLLHVADDPTTPAACQEALVKAAPPGTVVLRYANNAALSTALSGGRLFAWLGQQLAPAKQAG